MASASIVLSMATLSVIGVYGLHVISSQNGLYQLIDDATDAGLVTDFVTPQPQWMPKHPILGKLPNALLGFFWPVVSGENMTLSLVSLSFLGQVVAGWTVVVLEGYRGGLKGRLASLTTIFGLVLQASGFAVITPLYLIANLATSAAVKNATPANVMISDERYIKALPLALTTGFILPSIWMSLPFPSVVSLDNKALAILIWQIFPLLITISLVAFKPFFSAPSSSAGNRAATQLSLLRRTYAFGFTASAITHIATLSISILSVLVPGIFTARFADHPTPAAIWIPSLSTEQIPNAAVGSINLLVWDYLVGFAAIMVWTLASTSSSRGLGKGLSEFSSGNAVADAIWRTVLFGPGCASLTFVWERDELVLGSGHGKKA